MRPLVRRKPGRPSKLTRATRRRILSSISRGVPFVHAANGAGISYQTFLNYRRDRPDFEEAIAGAVAKGIEARLKVVHDALSSPDEAVRLRAACWYLEHTAPEHFARNRVEVTGKDGEPLTGRLLVLMWPHNAKENGTGNAIAANSPALAAQDPG
jgi:hypothetical protein